MSSWMPWRRLAGFEARVPMLTVSSCKSLLIYDIDVDSNMWSYMLANRMSSVELKATG